MGAIYKRGNVYWVKYYRGGRPFYESSGSAVHEDAKQLLKLSGGRYRPRRAGNAAGEPLHHR